MKEMVDTYSPTGVLEDYFRSSGSETSSSTDTFSQLLDSEAHQNSKPTWKWHGLAKLLKTNSKKPLASTVHPIRKLTKRMSRSMREYTAPNFQSGADSFNPFKSSWRNFSLKELRAATKSFSQDNLIGKGGYSEVYKGCLQNGQLVAVKRLTRGKPEEIDGFFLSEIGMMAHVNHLNTARLMGYCVEGGMHLFVLELSTKGSLASVLFGASKEKLEWEVRYKIALGVARGLKYLHEDCQRRIIHRDIKATNILLTEDFEAKICDFGLAKWLPEKWTHHTESSAEGTFGYLAPELLHDCIVDEKTDVYAFGVLLLELVTRRRALDYSQQSLIVWARPLLKKNQIKDLVDPSLADEYNRREVNLTLLVASLCIRASPTRRPRMGQVLQLLSGDLCCFKCMKKKRVKLSRRLLQLELVNVEDHELYQDFEDLHMHSRTSSSSGTIEDMRSPLEKVTLRRLLDHGYES